jgi:lactate permease
MFSLLVTLLPITVILVMLIVFRKPADISGIVGWLVVSLVAFFFFQTSGEVLLRSTVAGLVKSFSVSLIVATSLLQMAFMEKTGALKRIIIFIKTLATENKAVQIMMINIGFGTLMVAVGATPVSLLPPILLAMGYSTYVAIALPAIGYDSLCTYALLGAPIVVFVDVANGFLGKGHELPYPRWQRLLYVSAYCVNADWFMHAVDRRQRTGNQKWSGSLPHFRSHHRCCILLYQPL